jgi:hypothetical protein
MDKLYGTDQNADQAIMGGDAEVDGQNGETARRIPTETSPGDPQVEGV